MAWGREIRGQKIDLKGFNYFNGLNPPPRLSGSRWRAGDLNDELRTTDN